MINNKHKLLKIIVIGIFSVAMIIAINLLNKSDHLDPSSYMVLPIRSYYSEAEGKAFEWETDAYLVYIETKFAQKNKGNILTIHYSFRSLTSPGEWFSVSYAETNPVSIDISKGDFPQGDARPIPEEIDLATLTLDSLDAIAIAFEHGGSDFANIQHGISSESFVQLQQENRNLGTGELVWNVVFASSKSRFDTMFITLDALSGEVLEIKRTDE